MNHPWIGITGSINLPRRDPITGCVVVYIGPDYEELNDAMVSFVAVYAMTPDGNMETAPLWRFVPDDPAAAAKLLAEAHNPRRWVFSGNG